MSVPQTSTASTTSILGTSCLTSSFGWDLTCQKAAGAEPNMSQEKTINKNTVPHAAKLFWVSNCFIAANCSLELPATLFLALALLPDSALFWIHTLTHPSNRTTADSSHLSKQNQNAPFLLTDSTHPAHFSWCVVLYLDFFLWLSFHLVKAADKQNI